ncbi:MAG: gfo/Idh/MocA family oxidoreductase, partial [Arenicella sp.]|nr:gfo/Idh/MocA family oxidoreductase [Arenicella sp.]
LSLFATWHSRFAAAVQSAKVFLAGADIHSVQVNWKENVRKWHPGQQWVWQPGGLGVFDPGINALSILTEIIPAPLFVIESELSFPDNKAAPIAARLKMSTATKIPIELDFDWRAENSEHWSIVCATDRGLLRLDAGGANLSIDGLATLVQAVGEYDAIYSRFANLIRHTETDVDLSPLQLCADAFLIATIQQVAPFED